MEPRVPFKKASDTFGPMGQPPVPEKNDVTWHMTQQMGEEFHDLCGANILIRMESAVQAEAPVPGRDGNG